MSKLAIITSHPIQYYAPVFKLLSLESGIDVKVFYTYSQSKQGFYDKDFGCEIKWDVPLLEGYDYSFIENKAKKPGLDHFNGIKCPSLIREIENWKATHVLVFGWNYHAHLKALRFFKEKIQVWFRGDSTLLDERPSIKKIMRRLFLKWVYSHVDKAFYVGTNSKSYFKAHGLKDHQLVFSPHAIDNEKFSDSLEKNYTGQANQWRNQLGIEASDTVILFCGKFEPKKAPVWLLDTFIQFKEKPLFKNLKLIFVGSGILESQLKSKAQERNDVYFIPFQNQSSMPIIYRLGDLFCLPSRGPGETWGLVVNEAMASGLPVLASNKVGSAGDLVIEGKTGYIFQSNISSDFIEKVNLFLNSSIQKLGTNAQNEISEWSFTAIKRSIISALK